MTQQDQFLTAIDCDEAHRRFRSNLNPGPLGTENVLTANALGRILARAVVAQTNVPGFDRSNFDGFAINSQDTVGASEMTPRFLSLHPQKVPAGSLPTFELQPGQAAAISTGGMVPRGANAICLVEHSELVEDSNQQRLAISRSVFPGAGISFTGSDISIGETILRSGQQISSRESGVLAALGIVEIEVYRRPKVAVISTGNEIIPPGEALQPGQVFDSNARIISDAIIESGGEPLELGIAIDDYSDLETRVEQALKQADIVLLSGGTSKGEGDLSYRVVSRYEDPGIVAHGVALKPGKPICLAVTQNKPLVVLPGFPTSAIFTFHEFIAPVIRSMAGMNDSLPKSMVQAKLATRVNSEIGRTEFLLVGLTRNRNQSEPDPTSNQIISASDPSVELNAYPMGKGSGSVTTFSLADGFITIDRHQEILDPGETVNVQLIGSQWRPADLVVMGSHCQRLDQILDVVQKQGIDVKFFSIGSTGGLNAVKRGDCDLAGIHLYDPQSKEYNHPFADSTLSIQPGYSRTQGIIYRQTDNRWQSLSKLPLPEVFATIVDSSDLHMVNRNPGSGTRLLIDRMLSKQEPNRNKPIGYENQVSSHHAACAAVAQQRADWGVAIEEVAAAQNLGFLPLEVEQFDFAIANTSIDSPAIKVFMRELRKFQD